MNKLICYLTIFQLLIVVNETKGQSASFSERIYIHTDRDIYIAGEELFFKCYRYDANQSSLAGSKFAYLVLRNEKSAIVSGICLKLENNIFFGSIYLSDTLSTGKYQLVSYTNCMRNAGEDVFFTKEILIANRFDQDLIGLKHYLPSDTFKKFNTSFLPNGSAKTPILINPEKNTYTKHDRIKVSLDALGIKSSEIAQLSVSVHEKALQSDNNNNTQNKIIKADTVGIRDYTCLHLPEINGIILEGRVLSTDNQKTIPKATVYLSTPDTIANLQYTQTNDDGIFHFQLNEYYNNKYLILNLPDTKTGNIELVNKYELQKPFQSSKQFPDSTLKAYLVKSQRIVQVQRIYNIECNQEIISANPIQGEAPMVYPPVFNPVYPSDFVSLPDFVEISREILPFLKTRKREERYEARIIDVDNALLFNYDPQIFLDGVPINNINQIIGLGSEKIRKIETVAVERIDGNLFFRGILSVFSYKMEINNLVWETPALFTNHIAFHPASILKIPNFTKTDKTPDFRQLLYWEPSLTLKSGEKKTFEFSTSDNKGEFEITVEGITNNGNFIHANTTFKIK
jgi:hypothetical protein